MSVREPRWDVDWAIGRQGEMFVTDVIAALRDGATVETKTDKRAADTGRLYIEYECLGKPSGLRTTEAMIWAFVLGSGTLLFLPTDTLKRLARLAWRIPEFRVECARGSHPTRGVLIPLASLPKWLAHLEQEQEAA